jgi:hypothetical protein
MNCPFCKGDLTSYHSGIWCASCMVYYERNKWYAVACDDAHAHSAKCLVERIPPKPKKKAKRQKVRR